MMTRCSLYSLYYRRFGLEIKRNIRISEAADFSKNENLLKQSRYFKVSNSIGIKLRIKIKFEERYCLSNNFSVRLSRIYDEEFRWTDATFKYSTKLYASTP